MFYLVGKYLKHSQIFSVMKWPCGGEGLGARLDWRFNCFTLFYSPPSNFVPYGPLLHLLLLLLLLLLLPNRARRSHTDAVAITSPGRFVTMPSSLSSVVRWHNDPHSTHASSSLSAASFRRDWE